MPIVQMRKLRTKGAKLVYDEEVTKLGLEPRPKCSLNLFL